MKNENQSFRKLLALDATDLFQFSTQALRLEKSIGTARERFNGCKKFQAKVMAALKVKHRAACDSKAIDPSTSFRSWHEQQAGAKPNARIEALSVLFNRLVETGRLPEETFDQQTVDALEKANAALSAIEAKNRGTGADALSSDAALDVINALKTPGDAAKAIKTILAGVKGAPAPAAARAGLTLDQCFAALAPMIRGAGDLKPEAARELYFQTLTLQNLWAESGVKDEMLETWLAEFERQAHNPPSAPVRVTRAAVMAWIEREFPGIQPDEAAECLREVELFHETTHSLPASADALAEFIAAGAAIAA